MNTQVVEIRGQVEWRYHRDRASGRLVAVCPALNIATEADSLSELAQMMEETLDLLLEDLVADGEFTTFLSQHGWQLISAPPVAGRARFDIPVHLIPEIARAQERAAHQ